MTSDRLRHFGTGPSLFGHNVGGGPAYLVSVMSPERLILYGLAGRILALLPGSRGFTDCIDDMLVDYDIRLRDAVEEV